MSASTDSPVRFGRTSLQEEGGKETEIYKMTLGDESIPLLPLRNWTQLDVHKWVPRGKLAASPPGLEITSDHVKIAGETVSIKDPDGCAKLEKVFSEWLALERETLEMARKHAQPKPARVQEEAVQPGSQPLHFRVEIDKTGQVHIQSMRGKEISASIGLNTAGFKSLFSQGFMRKPHTLQVGALHDWVELDGVLFSFEKGNNDAAKLQAALNEKYLPITSQTEGKDVVIYANPASPTGFDIQFPLVTAGVRDYRRRPLNEESLELLQDPIKCGLLHKAVVIKLTRPMIVFKLKTPDGGERYFDSGPENMVSVTDEDGHEKLIDLARPVNYSHLSTSELTAVFNHPAIHKHGKTAQRPASSPAEPKVIIPAVPSPPPVPAPPSALPQASPTPAPLEPQAPPAAAESTPVAPASIAPLPAETIKGNGGGDTGAVASEAVAPPQPVEKSEVPAPPVVETGPRPNQWLEAALAEPPIRHDWFACLVYSRMAEFVRSSNPGHLWLVNCWSIALGDVEDVADPSFKGIFLTEKGGFGYLNEGHVVRFNNGVVLLGTEESAIEGIGVNLTAAGFDMEGRAVFVVGEDYRKKFGVADQLLEQELNRLKEFGALIVNTREILSSPVPIDVLWTVPKEQEDAQDPKAIESRAPELALPNETGTS